MESGRNIGKNLAAQWKIKYDVLTLVALQQCHEPLQTALQSAK